MTYFETLTLLLALLSNVIAFAALYRSKRVADRQLEFEALQAELAAYSLKQSQEVDAKKNWARSRLTLICGREVCII